MQNPLKYKLLADLIRSMEAEGIRFGTGKQLQIQELLRYLPNDIPLEDLKTYLSPIFAKNKQEQAHFYELFDQSLERVRAFTVAPTTLERQVETDEVAWWRNLIYLLLAGLILYLGWLTWRYFNPVPESTWEFLTIRLERNDTLHVELELRPDTITDISFCDGQKLGEGNLVSYYVDSLQIVFIAKDTFGLETPQICVQLVYAQPPVDTVILEVVVNDSPKEKPKPEFARLELQELPHPHKIEDLLVDPEEQARAQFYHDNAWWVKTLLILLFGTILWAIVQWREKKRRKLIAEIESRDQAPYIWNIQIEDALDIGLNESFRVALRQLRQRRRDEVFKLDIPRTVNATIQNAGLVDFQYKQQTKPPEYLILIDRQNRNDHRAMVYDDLYQSFRKNEVLVDRYFFDGDLRNCYNEIHPWGISLKDLQHQYHDSRLLIISDGYRLLSPMTGKMARWTSIFRSWPNRAILSPIPLEKWGRRERNLSERFQFMPASLDGLKVVLEQFDSLEPKPQEEMLAQVEDAPVESIKIKGSLINSLQTYFPKKLMHWIAACAVYPSLHWDLTLHLGRELSDEEQPLLTLDHLIQLVRLPWFVEGKIPDAAREELLQYLEKEGLETYVRQSLDELLQKAPKPEESSVAYEEYRMNVILNE